LTVATELEASGLYFEAASTAHLSKTILRSIEINTDTKVLVQRIALIEKKIRNSSTTTTYENNIKEDRSPPFHEFYDIEEYIQHGANGNVNSIIIVSGKLRI
jgi:hypothetical protein